MMEMVYCLTLVFMILSYLNYSPLPYVTSVILTCTGLTGVFWFSFNKWLGYSILLIFLGGMMVIFLYASILSSNEKLIFGKLDTLAVFFILFLISGITPMAGQKTLMISKVYSEMFFFLMLFLIFYILMVLFLVVKISEPLKGSLTKKF